ncbi:virginiamycin B lyase family protein [Lysobacter hankyongensis]|uniref:SMP-30/Gluconolactonase/LRE-like region domain-containing protein n=1 Tax=Lysobacter hankyongensis TaxID=1176535 RepID=A0ABP9B6Q3_9GAMM
MDFALFPAMRAVGLLVLMTFSATGTASTASSGRVREIEIDTPRSGPSIVVMAPDQAVWSSLARASRLLRVAPDGTKREYQLPEGSFPVGLLIDQDGTVWYSDIRKNQIVHFDPRDGARRAYDVPTKESFPFFLVKDAQGLVYFTERVGNKLGRLDPASGRFDEFPVQVPGAQPAGMAITPDGHIFFTQNSANRVGHFDPAVGKVVDVLVPSPATPGPFYGPAGITSDAKGNIWFCQLDGRLGLIRQENRTRIEEFPLPDPKVRPGGVVTDAHGLVWYTGLDGNMIGSFHPASGTFRRYDLPSGAADPRPMTPPEITARGEQPVAGMQARSTRPFGITVDKAGRVWFAEQYGHRLGFVEPPPLDVIAPVGTQRGAVADLNLLMRGAVAKAPRQVSVNGKPQNVAQDKLDLLGLEPGPHILEVVAQTADGPVTGSSRFVLAPDMDFLARAVARYARSTADAAVGIQGLWREVEAARAMRNLPEVRARIAAVRRSLPVDQNGAAALLRRQLLYVEMFGEVEVNVAATQEGCAPTEVVVQRGDRVRWTTEAGVRLLARDGSFASPISAGAWSHAFPREGRFEYACGKTTATVRVEPRSIDAIEAKTENPGRVPTVLVVDTPRGVWAAAGGGGYASLAAVPLNNKILRLTPDGRILEYDTPTPESAPTSIKMAPDGRLWFTERAAGKIGSLDPSSGRIEEFDIPSPGSMPTGIAVDHHDGMVWFTEKQSGKIGRFDPKRRTFEEFNTPHPKSEPSTIVLDHDGHVWFDERGADHLVRMNPRTLEMKTFPVPTKGSRVIGLVPDKRGYMWFLELAGQKIGRLDVNSGQIIEYEIPTRTASPFKAVLDRHGRLWFTQAYGNRIGVLQDGHVHEFALAVDNAMPGGIEAGEHGTLWFTQQATDVIAHVPDLLDIYVPDTDAMVSGIADASD